MILKKILHHLKTNNNLAFFIEENPYSYLDLRKQTAGIQQLLFQNKIQKNDIVLLHVYNDIETYASILAIWFTGATFVPINPIHAENRNTLIKNQMQFVLELSSNPADTTCIGTKNAISDKTIQNNSFQEQVLYILFTSGSTGIPKGVPISKRNLNRFILDFNAEFQLSKTDKFLQIYDLTFDASVHCYVLPLFLGASIYTVSPNKIKYLEAYKIMHKNQITFTKFPPSVLTYLQKFFTKIHLKNLKYSLLGGESLDATLAEKWQKCVPNAKIFNVYGPTEATINTHFFNFTKNYNEAKSYNGIVSIGKPFGSNKAIVVDKENQILPANSKGELCLGGEQITQGYFKNPQKNKTGFIKINNEVYYKTGDLVAKDQDGDFLFYGRKDNQIQIQGYRVELSEIEQIAKMYKNAVNFAVVAIKNKQNIPFIVLFAEQLKTETSNLHHFLKNNLPNYMIPGKIVNLKKFSLTPGGKVDYSALKKIAQKHV